MKKMSEKPSEMLLLMKELVEKVKRLETTVYDNNNMLMKSGFVVANSPTPIMNAGGSESVDSDRIAKMEWSEINDMVKKIEGGY